MSSDRSGSNATPLSRIAAGSALTLGLIVVLLALWQIRALALTAFLGLLFGLTLSRGVDFLQRWRIPRGAGAAMLVLSLAGLFWALGAWLAPTLREQSGEIRKDLPAAVDKLERWISRQPMVGQALGGQAAASPPPSDPGATQAQSGSGTRNEEPAQSPVPVQADKEEDSTPSLRERLEGQLDGAIGYLFPFLASTLSALSGVLLILFLSIYIAVDPSLYRAGLLHLFPHRVRPRASEVLESVSLILRRWMVANLISMAVIGVITTGALMLLGVKGAVALGILAGLSEFIPVFGPLLSAIPALAVAFLDSPQKALYVLIAYLVIQQIESNILTPLVMKEGVDVPPVVTILAGSVMAILFGFLGLLVAVPLVAAVMVVVKMTYVQSVIGDEIEVVGSSEDA